jgi:hypothetical protein
MKKGSLIILSLLLFCLGPAFSNVWIDENFDGTGPTSPPIWVQGDGGGSTVIPSDATLDVYANGGIGGVTITLSPFVQTGAKVTSKFFDGAASYEMDPNEGVIVGPAIKNPSNGAFVILQFAVSVDSIPAAGDVAELRYNWDSNSATSPPIDYSYYIKLVSDGSKVDIKAGEDVKNVPASEATIGSLASSSDWKFITMVMQNNTGSASYAHANLPGGNLTQANGVAFYCSSTTQGHFVAQVDTTGKIYRGWGLSVKPTTTAKVYLDTLYWEGGMDDTAFGTDKTQINLRTFDYAGSGSSVNDWALY